MYICFSLFICILFFPDSDCFYFLFIIFDFNVWCMNFLSSFTNFCDFSHVAFSSMNVSLIFQIYSLIECIYFWWRIPVLSRHSSIIFLGLEAIFFDCWRARKLLSHLLLIVEEPASFEAIFFWLLKNQQAFKPSSSDCWRTGKPIFI